MKKIQLLVAIPALSVSLLPLSNCNNTKPESEIWVTSVTISNTVTQVEEGQELELTATVKPNNASNKEVDWKIEDGADKGSIITYDNKVYLKGLTEGVVSIKAIAKDGGGAESKTVDFNVTKKSVQQFGDTDWPTLTSIINTFETSSQDEAAMKKLCSSFSDTPYIEDISSEITDPNRKIEAHLGSFIGKTNTITINGNDHVVRVIGINHDLLEGETTKYAAFTFELVTLLSDSNGDSMMTKWDLKNNNDYTNSVLRWNLNGNGSGTKPSSGIWDNSALSALPPELQSCIKTVQKSVATTSRYVLTTYNDKLFPLTYTEMAQSSEQVQVEGTAYSYWIINNTSNARIKKDVNHNEVWYSTTTPNIRAGLSSLFIGTNGAFFSMDVTSHCGVSFAFCI